MQTMIFVSLKIMF